MNAPNPILMSAIYVCVTCALYLQFKGLTGLLVTLDRSSPRENPAEKRARIAGAIGYLGLSAFFGIMGFAKYIQVTA